MSNYNRFSFLVVPLLIANLAFAKIHNFETTHLKSTAGAGVGSILLEESALLNPGSIVFYNSGSLYFQKDKLKTTDSNKTNYPDQTGYGFIMAQGQPGVSGALSYVTHKEDETIRKRFGLTMSGQIAAQSAMGITLYKTSDIDTNSNRTSNYYQTTFGITHAVSENTSLGIVLNDAFKSNADESILTIGIQQGLLDYIHGIVDFGGNIRSDNFSKNLILKGAIQVKLLDDFYLRFGGFNDKSREEKGEAIGLGWVQPKLAFEFAIKNTRSSILNVDKTKKETSFSISLRGF